MVSVNNNWLGHTIGQQWELDQCHLSSHGILKSFLKSSNVYSKLCLERNVVRLKERNMKFC